MRLLFLIQAGFFLLIQNSLYAQSPYTIAPKWYFGRQAGLNFTSGTPAILSGGKVDGIGQEASSTMCDPAGNVIFYTDSYRLYDGNHNFVQFINGGTSSTNSSVCFPDPSDPANLFYLVTANEHYGGGGEHNSPNVNGIYWYRIQKTGPGTISVVTAATQLAGNAEVSEQLCAGSDGNGGYWVVAHQGGGTGNGNQLWSWNFTSTGVGAKQISSIAGTDGATSYQGSLKINKCQNRLASVSYIGKVEVYDWDQSTGKVTNLYRSYSLTGGFFYGCEFSPDGNILYFTSLDNNRLYQFDLVNNAVIPLTGGTSSNNVSEMGTLQLGPDDKVYVTNVSNFSQPCYIGVVNNPNNAGTACNYNRTGFLLNNNTPGFWYPSIYRGIANQAWINPTLTINNTGACSTINFSYLFQTYFGSNVSVMTGSEQWDFGDGGGFQTGLGATPSHTYLNGGTYTVTLRVNDGTCNRVWTKTKSITIPPTAPTAVTISTGRDLCSDFSGTVTLTANGGIPGDPADPVEWYTGSCGGTLVHTGNPFSIPLSSPLVGTYKYFIRRNTTCGSSSCITDSIVVHANPVAPSSASTPAAVCSGTGGNVSLSVPDGAGERLVWYANGCGAGTAVGTGNPLSLAVPASTMDYYARWESAGCSASLCVQTTVTVNPSPTPSISGNATICVDSVRSFSTAASANTFSWVFATSGTGVISSGQGTNNVTVNAGSASGTLTLTETTAASCSTIVSVPVTTQSPAGTAALAGGDKDVCTASVQMDANNTTGTWTINSGTGIFTPDANTYNATVSGLSSGLNEFTWTTTGTCGFISTDVVAVTLGTSGLLVNAYTSADTVCFGSPKEIQVVPGGNGSGDYTYVWSSSDNSFNLSTITSIVTVSPVSSSTIYYVTIQDNVNTGCTSGDDVVVYALADQELVVPNLITPNGDEKNDYLEIKDKNERKILPGSAIEIVNRWGDRVYNHSSYDNTWAGTQLSDGLYYYHLKSGCGNRVYKGWLQIIH